MTHHAGPWTVDDRGNVWSPKMASPIARDVPVDDRSLIKAAPSLYEAAVRALYALDVVNRSDLGAVEEAKRRLHIALAMVDRP